MAKGDAIRALVAALGASAGSLGHSMQSRRAAADAEERALKRIAAQGADDPEWGPLTAGEDEDGPGLFQQNKRTGEVRRASTQRLPVVSDTIPKPNVTPGQPSAEPVSPRTLRPYVKPVQEKPKVEARRTIMRGADNRPVSVDPNTGLDPEGKRPELYQTPKDPGGGASKAPTEAQEKSYLFFNLMDKALPRIEAAQKSGKIRKERISAFMATPGLAADLVNVALNAEEQSYIRNLRDFAAGILRKESGAAVTHDELKDVFKRYAVGFGDAPELDAEKMAAAREYMGSMQSLALPAIEYYKARQSGGEEVPVVRRVPFADRVKQLKAEGLTREKAKAKLREEGYEVP